MEPRNLSKNKNVKQETMRLAAEQSQERPPSPSHRQSRLYEIKRGVCISVFL